MDIVIVIKQTNGKFSVNADGGSITDQFGLLETARIFYRTRVIRMFNEKLVTKTETKDDVPASK